MTDIVERLRAAAYAAERAAKRHDEALSTAPGSYASDFRQWRDEELASAAMAREAAAEIERLMARLAKWEPATLNGTAGSTFEPFRQPYSHQQTSDASQIWRETSSATRAAQMDGGQDG